MTKGIEIDEKVQEKPNKVWKSLQKVKETPQKVKRWVILTTLSKLKIFLIRYGIIKVPDTDMNEYLFENVKKPIITWIVSIILTSVPIYLVLILSRYIPPLKAIPSSIGMAILWWLVIEFKKDVMKR